MSQETLTLPMIGRLAEFIRTREGSPVKVTQGVLARIASLEDPLQAYIT
jgi:hypothetical protein